MNKKLFVLGTILVLASGCDQIQGLFSSKDKQPQPVENKQIEKKVEKSQNAPLPENVLAQVGSWTLTIEEFNQRLENLKKVVPNFDSKNQQARAYILEELLRQRLLVWEAENTGKTETKEIKEAVEDFRNTLLVRDIATKLTEGIEVTDADVKEYYEQNKQRLVEPSEWKMREIVVYTQEAAKEILIQVLQGGDFSQIAKDRSKGKTAANGGDLGFVKQFPFPQMESAVSALNVGDVSSVFKGPEGFYIVKLEEKKGGKQIELEKIQEQLKSELLVRKQEQAILQHLDQLRQQVPIKVNESLLLQE